MVDPDARTHRSAADPWRFCVEPERAEPTLGRVTRGVAAAIGKTLALERDDALPDALASLVERLQAGPLGQPSLKTHRVA